MKKRIAAYLTFSSVLLAGGFATEKFAEGFEFIPSTVNTADSVSAISLYGERVVITRNDSALAARADSSSFDLALPDTILPIEKEAMLQCSYDTATATLFFVSGGKLYSTNPNTPKRSVKALSIEGVTNVRHEFENSSIACRNWRYKERDTVMIFHPAVANGGRRIYFSAEMEGGLGGRDIWFIDKIEGKSNKWSRPVNVSKMGLPAGDTTSAASNNINSAGNEDYPFLANDSTIYFSSDRKAPLAGWNIYSASIAEGAKAQMAPDGINSDRDDKSIVATEKSFYVLSNRDGADKVYSPSLIVIAKTDEELPAAVAAVEPQEESEAASKTIAGPVAPQEKETVAPVAGKSVYTLYFEFNKDIMIENYDKEIAEILACIDASPQGTFVVCGHTDCLGSDSYNKSLSLRRAKRVYELLLKKGIKKGRLKYKGFGSSQPIVEGTTKGELQKNRRVEIIRESK